MQSLMTMDLLIEHCAMSVISAASITASSVGYGERTLRRWHSDYYCSFGESVKEVRGGNTFESITADKDVNKKVIVWLKKENCAERLQLNYSCLCTMGMQ